MTRTIWAAAAAFALLGTGQALAFQQPADTVAADKAPADASPAAQKLPDGTTLRRTCEHRAAERRPGVAGEGRNNDL